MVKLVGRDCNNFIRLRRRDRKLNTDKKSRSLRHLIGLPCLIVAILAMGCSKPSDNVVANSDSSTNSSVSANSSEESGGSNVNVPDNSMSTSAATAEGSGASAEKAEMVFGKKIESKLTATITKVLDGDTVKAKTEDDRELVVRMESIDAPEGKARHADMVLQKVTELLDAKNVELLVTGEDSRGRTLAFVELDGENMNAKMIELGLVRHFKRYSQSQELSDLEDVAKSKKLNIWADEKTETVAAGTPAPDGEAGELSAPLSILFWNVESDGASTQKIAEQLPGLGEHAIVGLCEVPGDAFETYENAFGEHYDSIRGTHFKEDHLQLIYDKRQLELLSWNEMEEAGGVRLNNSARSQRSPLLARFKQRDGDREFYVMVNHLARGNERFRQQQASALREWARTRQMPIIAIGDYNFDYVFETKKGNKAFSDFMQDNVWMWVKPDEMIDTNWYDEAGDGEDDYPGSMLDFMFVAGSAKTQKWKCEVIVREGDFPDDETTSDHRPVVLSLQE